jgi:hypothetical protein
VIVTPTQQQATENLQVKGGVVRQPACPRQSGECRCSEAANFHTVQHFRRGRRQLAFNVPPLSAPHLDLEAGSRQVLGLVGQVLTGRSDVGTVVLVNEEKRCDPRQFCTAAG